MSAKVLLGAMIAASVAMVMVAASRSRPAPRPAVEPPARPEAPWLTRQAAAQIVGQGGTLGPLFDDVEFGGPPPSAAVRARIAAFARANHVAIDLEITGGVVAAVRFDVTFGGCCGYEGAEVLALRADRPTTGGCVGGPETWLNDWAITHENGVHVRARVDVNRLVLRWARTLTVGELLARADGLVSADAVAVARDAREEWHAIDAHRRYLLELPYAFASYGGISTRSEELGFEIVADGGRVAEIAFTLFDRDAGTEITKQLRSQWGRPRVRGNRWIWQKADRIIEAKVEPGESRVPVTMRRRAT